MNIATDLETAILHFLCDRLAGHSISILRRGIGRLAGFSVGNGRSIAIRDLIELFNQHQLAPSTTVILTGWQDINTAPMDKTPVIIAVPTENRDGWIIGEAYFDPETYADGDWWWAGTDHTDHHGGPISDINHHAPEFWQPLPAPPDLITSKGSDNG